MKNSKKVLKQAFGIDVSKLTFVVNCSVLFDDFSIETLSKRTFKNTLADIQNFIKWAKILHIEQITPVFVLEATGVYFENLAYKMTDCSFQVAVLLPNKASAFISSHNIKSKTDNIDAAILAKMGLERKLALWNAQDPVLRELKVLAREREQLQKEKTKALNQLHAYACAYEINKKTISRTKKRIKFFDSMIQDIEKNIEELVKQHHVLDEKLQKITTIPGIGITTAVIIIAETNGFSLIRNSKQLVSYSGLDVQIKQSGTSLNKKTRISKKGNSHIRKALYMPALAASRNKNMKVFYERVNQNKPSKKIGVIALEQKLLKLIYSLWKSGQKYDPNYIQNSGNVKILDSLSVLTNKTMDEKNLVQI